MKRLYFITGMPLAGKSTLAKKMSEYIPDAALISTGDIARKLTAASADPNGVALQTAANDKYPGEETLRGELAAAIENSPKFHIIIEGFPRDVDQLKWIKDKYWHYFPKLVVADVGSYETLYNRARMRARDEIDRTPELLIKRLHAASKNIYGLSFEAQKMQLSTFVVNTLLSDINLLKEIAKVVKK